LADFFFSPLKQLLEKIQNYLVSLGRQHGKLKSKSADRKNHHNNPILTVKYVQAVKYQIKQQKI